LYKYLNVGISFFENQNPGTFNTLGLGLGEGDRTLLTNHVTKKE